MCAYLAIGDNLLDMLGCNRGCLPSSSVLSPLAAYPLSYDLECSEAVAASQSAQLLQNSTSSYKQSYNYNINNNVSHLKIHMSMCQQFYAQASLCVLAETGPFSSPS